MHIIMDIKCDGDGGGYKLSQTSQARGPRLLRRVYGKKVPNQLQASRTVKGYAARESTLKKVVALTGPENRRLLLLVVGMPCLYQFCGGGFKSMVPANKPAIVYKPAPYGCLYPVE